MADRAHDAGGWGRPRYDGRWRSLARHELWRTVTALRTVRGPGSLLRFLVWFADALDEKLVVLRSRVALGRRLAGLEPAPVATGLLPRGPQAEALFPPCRHRTEAPVQVVLSDALSAAPPPPHAVRLADHPALQVPPFDPREHNPVGWASTAASGGVALGPRRDLPAGVDASAEMPVGGVWTFGAQVAVDAAAFHDGPVARAGALVRLAARGVPVFIADGALALRRLLGADLYEAMRRDPRPWRRTARELHGIRQRRLAHRDHTVAARARQVFAAAGVAGPAPPSVSVLLATRRPAYVAHALDGVFRQSYPRLELVLALHGGGFEDIALERALAGAPIPVTVLRVAPERSLGAVLNAAADAACGDLLAKMDDDDVYGAEHVEDLVAARAYSGAQLVGKGNETIYVAALDRTLGRAFGPGERYFRHVTGSALLIGRDELRRFGRWREVPAGVDVRLVRDVMRRGGLVYRTHGAGYVYVRHDDAPTWQAPPTSYLMHAEFAVPGWRPELAGVPGASLPPVRP